MTVDQGEKFLALARREVVALESIAESLLNLRPKVIQSAVPAHRKPLDIHTPTAAEINERYLREREGLADIPDEEPEKL